MSESIFFDNNPGPNAIPCVIVVQLLLLVSLGLPIALMSIQENMTSPHVGGILKIGL